MAANGTSANLALENILQDSRQLRKFLSLVYRMRYYQRHQGKASRKPEQMRIAMLYFEQQVDTVLAKYTYLIRETIKAQDEVNNLDGASDISDDEREANLPEGESDNESNRSERQPTELIGTEKE